MNTIDLIDNYMNASKDNDTFKRDFYFTKIIQLYDKGEFTKDELRELLKASFKTEEIN